nr:hypothetical protein [Tanacetum cinerariifolium]
MREFYKNHPSRSSTVTKTTPSVAKIKPSITNDSNNEQVSSGEDSDQEKDSDDQESDHEENEEDEDDEESKITDRAKGDEDEDEEIDNTIKEGTDAAMTNIQQRKKNLKILQVIEDAHVTLSTVPWKSEVPITRSSHSSDLVAKFLNFLDIPYTDAEIVSPMDVHVHHEVPSQQTPTLLTGPVLVTYDSSPIFSTVIP